MLRASGSGGAEQEGPGGDQVVQAAARPGGEGAQRRHDPPAQRGELGRGTAPTQ